MLLLLFSAGCGNGAQGEDLKETQKMENDVAVFSDGKHIRSEDYAAEFATKGKDFGDVEIQIAEDIFTEENGNEICARIREDCATLAEASEENSGETPKVTIYVVGQTIAGKPQSIGSDLFCSQEDITSGNYQSSLVKSYFGLQNMWQCIGLADSLFGTKEDKEQIDVEELKEYYSATENINAISLFPSYFSSEFADEKTEELAEHTAFLLTQYITDTYGMQEFLTKGDTVSNRNEWLESIGVAERCPWSEEEFVPVQNLAFSSTIYDPLIVKSGIWYFYLEATDWMVTPEDAFLFVKNAVEGYQKMKSQMIEFGLDNIDSIRKSFDSDKSIHVKNSTSSYSYATQSSSIVIRWQHDVYHEMVHALFGLPAQDKKTWMTEGLAEYFAEPAKAQQDEKLYKSMMLEYLTDNDGDWETAEVLDFKKHLAAFYEEHGGMPKSVEDVDTYFFYETVAKMKTLNEDIVVGMPKADISLDAKGYAGKAKAPKQERGNSLCYMEAYVFITYLVDKYDMETVVRTAIGTQEFETAFGRRYEEEYLMWMEEMQKETEYIFRD